jgi:predicted ATPase
MIVMPLGSSSQKMFVMISGCSGGGKSTLLLELKRRGYAVVEEPGRRIIAEARCGGETRTLPWVDASAFARRALEMAVADFRAARGLTFFDRGVVDAAVAVASTGGEDPISVVARLRYDRLFFAPPWPEIYVTDEDRRHSLEKALSDYERVRQFYLNAGYRPVMLPRETVQARADFIISELGI